MPRWLSGVLPEQARYRGQDQAIVLLHPERAVDGPHHREMAETFNSATVKAVCGPCNNGFMNEIEAEARPYLSTMIRGNLSMPLAAEAANAVATWAVKTSLMAQLTGSEPAALAQVYRDFYATGRPTPECMRCCSPDRPGFERVGTAAAAHRAAGLSPDRTCVSRTVYNGARRSAKPDTAERRVAEISPTSPYAGRRWIFRVSVMTMVEGTTPHAARKKARERAAALLDAQDAERRRLEAERRKRVTDHAAEIAGNDAEIAQLNQRIEELNLDSVRRLTAIVGDGVSEAQAAEMTGREVRQVRSAVKAVAADQAPATEQPAARKATSPGPGVHAEAARP
jgi:hypothetical protein